MDNMSARLFSTEQEGYVDLFHDIKILDSCNWPEIPVLDYGRDKLHNLCQRVRFESPAIFVFNDLSDYKENLGRGQMPLYRYLRRLKSCIDVIPCSTAECERGFSCMNVIYMYSELRNRLLKNKVSSLLFIKIQGPPLCGSRRSTVFRGFKDTDLQKTLRPDWFPLLTPRGQDYGILCDL